MITPAVASTLIVGMANFCPFRFQGYSEMKRDIPLTLGHRRNLKPVVSVLVLLGAFLVLGCGDAPHRTSVAALAATSPQSGLPVFPGAEGFGTRTRAGRGGKLIEVTSLADSGPGTLREALEDPSPRIIVFRVGGTIKLQDFLYVSHPFVTLAGQTAPGDGILIKDFGIVIVGHDVLIQHIRVRPGNEGAVNPDHNDAFAILGKHGNTRGAYNVVLDHISASWAEDETISTWYGPHDVTISWSIISEALDRSRHPKGRHGAGLLIGDRSDRISVHHNLLAHNDFRNPLISGGGTHDFVNNVIYNWGKIPAEIINQSSRLFVNFVGNYFISGRSTDQGPYEILFTEGRPEIYVKGNLGPHRPNSTMSEWALVGFGWGAEGVAPEKYRSHKPFAAPAVTTFTAEEAMKKVLQSAGATSPRRDSIDLRVVGNVRDRLGTIINSPKEVGGYPRLASGPAPVDSDRDGMPDVWEKKMGLNPNDPTDGKKDRNGDGYTNVEKYLHSLLR